MKMLSSNNKGVHLKQDVSKPLFYFTFFVMTCINLYWYEWYNENNSRVEHLNFGNLQIIYEKITNPMFKYF